MGKIAVLIVDDETICRSLCRDVLKLRGFETEEAGTGEEALAALARRRFDLVLTDIRMPGMSGMHLLEKIKSAHPGVDVVMLTGYGTVESATQAMKKGAADYLRKPFDNDELVAVVEGIVARRQLAEDNLDLRRKVRLHEAVSIFIDEEEPERVLELGLDVLAQELGCDGGVAFLSRSGVEYMAVVAGAGVTFEEGEAIRRGLVGDGRGPLTKLGGVTVVGGLRFGRFVGRSRFARGLLVPVMNQTVVVGALAGLRAHTSQGFTRVEREEGSFIGEHVSLAWSKATKLRELKELAYVDPLTGLGNGRGVGEDLEKLIGDRVGFSLLFGDIDGFKRVNDRWGHLAGGEIIRQVGKLLATEIDERMSLYRYSGDQFVVIFRGALPDEALELAEKFKAVVTGNEFAMGGSGVERVSISFATAVHPEDGCTAEELLARVDEELNRVKRAG